MSGARIFTESYWNVERDNGGHVICGFSTSADAHAHAKPRGFRTAGTVIRHDVTRSWVVDGDLTVSTETIRRTTEPVTVLS